MKRKNSFIKICFSSAMFIILLILNTNIISLLGWILNISISSFHLPIAFIVTTFINYYIQKKYRKISKKEYLVSVLLLILLFAFSLLIANMFLDISYDGAWYHSIAIIRLKDGWNPLYELVNSGQFGDIYIDSYASKSIWGFGAAVYSLFGNLNSIKMISTLVACAVVLLSISIFSKFANKKVELVIIIIASICIGFNPIYISQVFTNYIDSTLGLYCTFYILLFISYYQRQVDFDDVPFAILISSCIALMSNTKLTGLYFAATFFAFFVIAKIIQKIKEKKFKTEWFKKMFLTGLFGVVLAFIIGINPFVTNVIHGHNMFYPILGSEKVDVMGANVPEALRSKSNLEKILIANLSQTTNYTYYDLTILQNPFVVTRTEYRNINQDTRIGGFGPLFALMIYILIISLIVFSKSLLKKSKNGILKQSIFCAMLFIILNALIFPESWWARYYPVLWIVPILLAIYYLFSNNKKMKTIGIILIALACINVLGIAYFIYNDSMASSGQIVNFVSELRGEKIMFWCYDDDKKWDYSYFTYFKENGVEAISADEEIEDYDFKGYNIEIKILED